jgi:plastocyanin
MGAELGIVWPARRGSIHVASRPLCASFKVGLAAGRGGHELFEEATMRTNRFISLTTAGVLSVALIAGCGGDDNKDKTNTQTTPTTQETTPTTGGGGTASKSVTVKMQEYSFGPSDVTIARGGTITVENAGKISHNLTIEQGPDPKQETKKLAGTSTFLPGKSEKLTVNLKPGKYAMACTVPGHREQGMVGTITVK